MKPSDQTQYRIVPERWGHSITYYVYEQGVNNWRLATSQAFQSMTDAEDYLRRLISAIRKHREAEERGYNDKGVRLY